MFNWAVTLWTCAFCSHAPGFVTQWPYADMFILSNRDTGYICCLVCLFSSVLGVWSWWIFFWRGRSFIAEHCQCFQRQAGAELSKIPNPFVSVIDFELPPNCGPLNEQSQNSPIKFHTSSSSSIWSQLTPNWTVVWDTRIFTPLIFWAQDSINELS